MAEAQRAHFWWVLGILAVFVAGPILLLLPIFAWRYRYGSKTARYTPRWDYSRGLEIMSWGGPIVIFAGLALFVWRDTHRLDPYKPVSSAQPPLQVEVIGYDWKWLFIYPDQGIASMGTLALPTGRAVTLHLTSATVMQSFFIPAMGSQIYAMGGMVTELNLQADKVGISMGENTMYNGVGFHQQKFAAQAMSPADFEAWVGMVRTAGIALDGKSLSLVAQRGTLDDLAASLPGAAGMQGDVYFTGVSQSLFSDVVMATMDAKPTPARSAFDSAPAAVLSGVATSVTVQSR